jgi:hypothetical protein
MSLPIPKKLRGQTPSHVRSRNQERSLAKLLGGRVTKASGAQIEKADVRLRGVARIECKTTQAKSFSVSTKHIKALEASVNGTAEVPLMEVELEGGATKFVVLPGWALQMIVDNLREQNEPESS